MQNRVAANRAQVDRFRFGMETNLPAETANEETLWTNEDVAKFFRCTVRHVQNLQKGGLPYFHLGRLVRFDPEEVRLFVRSHRDLRINAPRRLHRLGLSDRGRK